MSSFVILIILCVIVLIVLSGFFSASETALTAASRAKMHILEKEGNKKAKLVNHLRGNTEVLLGTILLGNTLINSLCSSLITSVMTPVFGEAGIFYATIIITILLLSFSEILPKSYAINYPDKFALFVSPFINFMTKVLSPFVIVIQIFTDGILKIFGVTLGGKIGYALGDEELRGAIDLHHDPEFGTKGKRAMLRSILDLRDVDLEDIMIHRKNVEMVDIDLPTKDIIERILSCPYTRIPLWQNDPDNIIGVLHAKNLLRALRQKNDKDINILSLAQKPWFVPETTSLFEQLTAFRERHEHFAVIVDEYGTFMGIVTLEDILEEIVGDITDEYDVRVNGIKQDEDGTYLIEGTVTLRDLNRELGWDLPVEEASTIAGLLLHESRDIPDVGQILEFYNFRFEVIRKQKNQIILIKVTPPTHHKN
jgi:Mg2+/Co2+ transporter CorB